MTISELAAQLRMAKQAETEAKAERLRIEGLITDQFAKPESNEGTHNDEEFTITWKLNDPKSGQETLLNNSVNDNDEEISTSRLTLRGTLNLRGKQLTCLVDHPLLNKSFSSWVNINLKCKYIFVSSFKLKQILNESNKKKSCTDFIFQHRFRVS